MNQNHLVDSDRLLNSLFFGIYLQRCKQRGKKMYRERNWTVVCRKDYRHQWGKGGEFPS